MKGKSLSRVRLLVIPMDCSLPGSSIHGIFQTTEMPNKQHDLTLKTEELPKWEDKMSSHETLK